MFKLKLNTANEAFDDCGAEIARILREVANKVDAANALIRGKCYDINGNLVGSWEVKG